MFIRLMELIAKGIPFFIVGSPESDRHHELMSPLPMKSVPKYYQKIADHIQGIFQNPAALFEICKRFQSDSKKVFPLVNHCDLWSSRYEEMIEDSLSEKIKPFQSQTILGKIPARALGDEEFFKLLACPRCHAGLEADITETKEDRAWHGTLTCTCGERYPLIHGIPRIFENAWDFFHDPKIMAKRSKLTPMTYWQKHFEQDPLLLKTHYRKILAPLMNDLHQDDLVLCMQCGTGGALLELARQGARGIGLDQGEHIEVAQKFLWNFPQFRLVQGNAKNPPLRYHSFEMSYHAEGTLNSLNPSNDLSTWKKLLVTDGNLHLLAHELPNPQDRHFYETLTSFSHSMPYRLVSILAAFLVTSQNLKKSLNRFHPLRQSDFHALHSIWFRLLSYPDINLANERQLKIWAEKANLNNLKIQSLKPWGYHLQASP